MAALPVNDLVRQQVQAHPGQKMSEYMPKAPGYREMTDADREWMSRGILQGPDSLPEVTTYGPQRQLGGSGNTGLPGLVGMQPGGLVNTGLSILDYYNNQNTARDVTKNVNQGYQGGIDAIGDALGPYTDAGHAALTGYMGKMSEDPIGDFSYTGQDMYNDPGYLFRLQQGQDAVSRGAAARGMNLSSNVLKGLDAYTQGQASQEFGAGFNRAKTTYDTNSANYQRQLGNYLPVMNAGLTGGSAMATGIAGLVGKQGEASANRELLQGMNRGGLYNDAGALATDGGRSGTTGLLGDIANGIDNIFGGSIGGDIGNLISGSIFDADTWGGWFEGMTGTEGGGVGTMFWDAMGGLADFFR